MLLNLTAPLLCAVTLVASHPGVRQVWLLYTIVLGVGVALEVGDTRGVCHLLQSLAYLLQDHASR